MFNGKIRFCTYEQSYTDFFGKDNITELESLEIACDETVENTGRKTKCTMGGWWYKCVNA